MVRDTANENFLDPNTKPSQTEIKGALPNKRDRVKRPRENTIFVRK